MDADVVCVPRLLSPASGPVPICSLLWGRLQHSRSTLYAGESTYSLRVLPERDMKGLFAGALDVVETVSSCENAMHRKPCGPEKAEVDLEPKSEEAKRSMKKLLRMCMDMVDQLDLTPEEMDGVDIELERVYAKQRRLYLTDRRFRRSVVQATRLWPGIIDILFEPGEESETESEAEAKEVADDLDRIRVCRRCRGRVVFEKGHSLCICDGTNKVDEWRRVGVEW